MLLLLTAACSRASTERRGPGPLSGQQSTEHPVCANVAPPPAPEIILAATAEPALLLDDAGALVVRVRSTKQESISGAAIALRTSDDNMLRTITDSAGVAHLRGSALPGMLAVRRIDYMLLDYPLRLRAGFRDTVRVTLPCAIRIRDTLRTSEPSGETSR